MSIELEQKSQLFTIIFLDSYEISFDLLYQLFLVGINSS